jgi:hypothetical protein
MAALSGFGRLENEQLNWSDGRRTVVKNNSVNKQISGRTEFAIRPCCLAAKVSLASFRRRWIGHRNQGVLLPDPVSSLSP